MWCCGGSTWIEFGSWWHISSDKFQVCSLSKPWPSCEPYLKKLMSGSTLRVVAEVVGAGVKFGVFRGAVAFVDVFNLFTKAGAPVVPTLTNERTPTRCYCYCKNKPYPKSRYNRSLPDPKVSFPPLPLPPLPLTNNHPPRSRSLTWAINAHPSTISGSTATSCQTSMNSSWSWAYLCKWEGFVPYEGPGTSFPCYSDYKQDAVLHCSW